MKEIDTTNWQEFRVGDLFEISRPDARSAMKYDKGNMGFVASGNFNNGIMDYFEPKNEEDFDEGNCITVSPVDGYAFYQKDRFLGRGGAGSSIIIMRNNNLNEYNGKYICTVVRKACREWTYANMGNKDTLADMLIKLPITKKDSPDWKSMELYMQEVENNICNDKLSIINSLNRFSKSRVRTNTKWKRFHLYDENLFTIDSGTKLDRIKMSNNNPSINFVGRANANNGVTDYIDRIEGLKPYDAGCLTISLGGEYLGSCFIQEKPFYTSQNVNVLIPKHPMSDYCKRFISTMIFREGRLHYKAFVDELNRHMKTDFTILLPVTSDNKPDWDYMEKYMQMIEQKTKNVLKQLAN